MKVSVIMSTYYKEKPEYLNEALRSIWTNQIRRPDEIILVEDGMLPTELEQVVTEWEHTIGSSFVVLRNKQNRGLATALNEAIAVATGDFLARMDSDDISTPERFLLQEQYMIQHPDVDILGGSLREFNDTNTLDIVRTYPLTMDKIEESIHRICPLAHPAVMFRRRFFESGIRYTDRYPLCEDITLWFEAVHAHRVINNLPDIILLFRRTSTTMSRRSRAKAWNEFKAYNHGIYRVNGIFTTAYIYSLMRLIFRNLPCCIITKIYQSSTLRNHLATRNGKSHGEK